MKRTKIYGVCSKCNGTGRVFDHEDGIFSFGLDYLFQICNPESGKKKCPTCKGTGQKINLIIEED